jgi:chemotaxis protein methyltransferase CheR
VLLLGAGETVIGHSDDFIPHPDFRGAYARRQERSCSEALRRAI